MLFRLDGSRLDVIHTKLLDKPNMNDLNKLNIIVATFYGVNTAEHAEAIKRMARENESVFTGENVHEQ